MNSKLTFGDGRPTIDIRQESIPVTLGIESIDPDWRATDINGHEHYYDGRYPTLELIIDASHWCDGHEGPYNHDPHEAVDDSHYECLVCRVVVEPGTLPPYMTRYIAGPRSGTVTGLRADGAKVVVALTGDDMKALADAGDEREAVAQQIVDTSENVIEWFYSST